MFRQKLVFLCNAYKLLHVFVGLTPITPGVHLNGRFLKGQ